MNNKRNRRIAMIVAVLMLTMAFSTTGFAAWMGKTIEAQYRNITIFVNNQYKQATTANGQVVEPFIVDGTTYVPLRGVAQMLGYQVSFNPQTYRIDITGSGDSAAAQYEILLLQARIAELEDELEELEGSSMDLDDLEDQLNDDYDEIDGVDVEDIILDGDEDDIEVEIYIDTTRSSQLSAWTDLSESDIEDFLQDIIDDILDEYPDADITGFIEDEYDDKKVETFGIDNRGDVNLGASGSYDISDIDDLEDALNSEFDEYEGLDFDFIVDEESDDDIFLDIYVETGELDDLTNSEIEAYLEDVCEFIIDEYADEYIYGVVWDDVDEIEFDYDRDSLDWNWN